MSTTHCVSTFLKICVSAYLTSIMSNTNVHVNASQGGTLASRRISLNQYSSQKIAQMIVIKPRLNHRSTQKTEPGQVQSAYLDQFAIEQVMNRPSWPGFTLNWFHQTQRLFAKWAILCNMCKLWRPSLETRTLTQLNRCINTRVPPFFGTDQRNFM